MPEPCRNHDTVSLQVRIQSCTMWHYFRQVEQRTPLDHVLMDHLRKIRKMITKKRKTSSLPMGKPSPTVSKPCGGASAISSATLTAVFRHERVWTAACRAGATASGPSPPRCTHTIMEKWQRSIRKLTSASRSTVNVLLSFFCVIREIVNLDNERWILRGMIPIENKSNVQEAFFTGNNIMNDTLHVLNDQNGEIVRVMFECIWTNRLGSGDVRSHASSRINDKSQIQFGGCTWCGHYYR